MDLSAIENHDEYLQLLSNHLYQAVINTDFKITDTSSFINSPNYTLQFMAFISLYHQKYDLFYKFASTQPTVISQPVAIGGTLPLKIRAGGCLRVISLNTDDRTNCMWIYADLKTREYIQDSLAELSLAIPIGSVRAVGASQLIGCHLIRFDTTEGHIEVRSRKQNDTSQP